MKPVSDQLFTFEDRNWPVLAYERCSAKDLNLKEAWLRDAIFQTPELVIGPCRAAGIADGDWYPWDRENWTAVGPVDVLLVSSEGRVAIVETKLATNPELRRRVLAQALDYLTHLADSFADGLPELPRREDGDVVADADDVRESVAQGDVLVIVASDEVDPRVAKLSRGLLGDHVTQQWDLALVDVALYRSVAAGSHQYIVVPHLRNLIEADPRQVVRVIVEGETPSARIKVERITGDEFTSARQVWDEHRFLEALELNTAPAPVRALVSQLLDMVGRSEGTLVVSWGRGKQGSMTLKRNNGGLIEIYGSGWLSFRPSKFPRALGDVGAAEYRAGLEKIAPAAMTMRYPQVKPMEAARAAPSIGSLLVQVLSRRAAP